MTSVITPLKPEERLLFIFHDYAVHSRTRIQKYGFLLSNLYESKLKEIQDKYFHNFKWYDDWKAHYYGPYSEQLQQDLKTCIEKKIITQVDDSAPYELTLKGRIRWRKFYLDSEKEMKILAAKIKYSQECSLFHLLEIIYKTYPEYTDKNKIKEQFA